MIIRDTYPQILRLSERVKGGRENWFAFWDGYIRSCAEELRTFLLDDSKEYDRERQIRPYVVSALTRQMKQLKQAHTSFLEIIDQVWNRFYATFGSDQEITVYFYVGLCNGVGRAVKIRGEEKILLGAEKIVQNGWCSPELIALTLAHELCHIAHARMRRKEGKKNIWQPEAKNIWMLYREGIAHRYANDLVEKSAIENKAFREWESWCQNHKKLAAQEYWGRIGQDRFVHDFFEDQYTFHDRKHIGYFLGGEFILFLEQRYAREEILIMDFSQICLEAQSFFAEFNT